MAKVKLEVGSTSTKNQKSVGSVRWRAPELFDFPPPEANASADIYSFGMILWELASGKLPYSYSSDDAAVVNWITTGKKEKIPDTCPKSLAEIIQSCWADAKHRPTAEILVKRLQMSCKAHDEEELVARRAAEKAAREAEETERLAAEKIWHFDSSLKPSADGMKEGFALISAGPKDMQKVLEAYRRFHVPGYEVGRVQIIYSLELNRAFAAKLKLLQKRYQNPAFTAKWHQDKGSEQRAKVDALAKKITASYVDKDTPNVRLLLAWHGTKPSILSSIFETGFANLAEKDPGYFGKGIYGAYEAEYSYRVYSKGAFLLNWFAWYSAYPVIAGDMDHLMSSANYGNYDAHIAPVVPEFSDEPNPESYVPCKPGELPHYTEVVVFESSQCLPRYLVELQASLVKAPSLSFASAGSKLIPSTGNSQSLLYAFLSSKVTVAGSAAGPAAASAKPPVSAASPAKVAAAPKKAEKKPGSSGLIGKLFG